MPELATLARPYANAVYDLAKQADRVSGWSNALQLLVQISKTDEVKLLLGSPTATHMHKAHTLNELLGEEHATAEVRRFVSVLAENGRLELLSDIEELFELKRAEDSRVMDVTIASAVPLSADEEASYKEALEKRFDREVVVNLEVDQALIGGAFIRAGDTVLDGSVRGKLRKMQEALSRA